FRLSANCVEDGAAREKAVVIYLLMTRFIALTVLLAVLAALPSPAEDTGDAVGDPAITAGEIMSHIKYLSSDYLEGREAGAPGSEAAARYVARIFEESGVRPAGDGGTYFQEFPISPKVALGKSNYFYVSIKGKKEG